MAGIYIHIPFCKQRCIYCDFYSTVQQQYIDDYIDAVVSEARMRPLSHVRTVYVGGGTPSLLSVSQFTKLVDGLCAVYDLNGVEEFTVEVNPDDVTADYVKALMACGVNRISMGVQSFDDNDLLLVNRRHDAKAALRAIEVLKGTGIANISIDLIYGIPGQTVDSWQTSVARAIETGVNHISAYNLSYEEGTKLWMMRETGQIAEVDEATCVMMYNKLVHMLKCAGYDHYEISNYCLPGYHSRHNSSYWDGTPFVGLGASAHSYDGNARVYNPASVKDYIRIIKNGETACVVEETEWWEKYDEMIMVALRTAKGLDVEEVKRRFGSATMDKLLCKAGCFINQGLLEKSDGRLYIPEEAMMMSDMVIRELMW